MKKSFLSIVALVMLLGSCKKDMGTRCYTCVHTHPGIPGLTDTSMICNETPDQLQQEIKLAQYNMSPMTCK